MPISLLIYNLCIVYSCNITNIIQLCVFCITKPNSP